MDNWAKEMKNGALYSAYLLGAIHQFTEPEPSEPFEIPVVQVFRNNREELVFSIIGGNIEDWHYSIFANAEAIKECKWVTVESLRKEARFWADDQFPKFGQDHSWVSENGCRDRQYVHPSLIPTDYSRAIVRIEHV